MSDDTLAAIRAQLESGEPITIDPEQAPALVDALDRAERLPKRPRKTHCKNKHAMTGDNVYRQPKTGANRCRACWRERARKAYQKRKGIAS